MEKKTEKKDLTKAYAYAKKIGRRFAETHPRPVYHLDEDDYAQEAMMAWLDGKHIPYRLVDAYRRAAPISRRDWAKEGKNLKLYDPINVDFVSDSLAGDGDVEEDAEKLIRLKKIQEIVNKMVDPRQQIIILMVYVNDMSFTDIAKGLNLSNSYISKLHTEALDYIRKELKEDGYL